MSQIRPSETLGQCPLLTQSGPARLTEPSGHFTFHKKWEDVLNLQKAFLVLGTMLFLAGLLTGLATGVMANPRMGLSAHMQGLTNGMFLLAVGASWRFVSSGPLMSKATFWLLAYGTVAKLVVYNACCGLEYRGADPNPRLSTFGSALARNDRLFRTLIAFACYDPRNYTAARRLFAV